MQRLCRDIANNINFHYRINSEKINDQISQLIQKTLFLTHFWDNTTKFLKKGLRLLFEFQCF